MVRELISRYQSKEEGLSSSRKISTEHTVSSSYMAASNNNNNKMRRPFSGREFMTRDDFLAERGAVLRSGHRPTAFLPADSVPIA